MDNTDLFFKVFNLNGQLWILDKLMVFAAEPLIYLIIIFIFLLGIKGNTQDKKAFLLILLAIPISVLLIKGIHLFYFEPRPFVALNFIPIVMEEADATFPSRHATIASVIAFSHMYFKSKWAPLLLFFAIWIGVSRVYVGVHYPLDIPGGFVTASLALVLGLQVKNVLTKLFLRV